MIIYKRTDTGFRFWCFRRRPGLEFFQALTGRLLPLWRGKMLLANCVSFRRYGWFLGYRGVVRLYEPVRPGIYEIASVRVPDRGLL